MLVALGNIAEKFMFQHHIRDSILLLKLYRHQRLWFVRVFAFPALGKDQAFRRYNFPIHSAYD